MERVRNLRRAEVFIIFLIFQCLYIDCLSVSLKLFFLLLYKKEEDDIMANGASLVSLFVLDLSLFFNSVILSPN